MWKHLNGNNYNLLIEKILNIGRQPLANVILREQNFLDRKFKDEVEFCHCVPLSCIILYSCTSPIANNY